VGSLITGPLIAAIVAWWESVVLAALNILWNLLAKTAFVSPDVTVLPQVKTIAGTSLGIVNVTYVLAILWMAILVLGRDTIQSRYGPGELIPRLVIGLIGANLAMPLCSQLIGLANAVTSALTSQDITSAGSMQQLHNTVISSMAASAIGDPTGVLLVLIGLVISALFAVTLVQWIVRVGVLIVAVGISPIALALHGTPQTEPAAKLWWRTVLGTLSTVVLQAVTLHTALTVFLNPQVNLPAIGLPGNAGAVMNLMIVLCLLWAIVKIPSMMRRYVTKSSPSQAGTVVRVLLMQQLTRGLSRAVGKSGAARNAAAGRAASSGIGGRGPDRPWPTASPRGGSSPRGDYPQGGSRPMPRPAASAGHGPARPARVPSRKPAGAGPGVIGTAYPTGRPVKAYTPDELAEGVDVYTRSLRRRGAASTGRNSS
jgi:hypothetical protein